MQAKVRAQKRWIRAFSTLYQALPEDAHVPCPNCGADELRVVFVGEAGKYGGYGFFWCNRCLHGIGLDRVHVPEGVEAVAPDHTDDEINARVPNFTIV